MQDLPIISLVKNLRIVSYSNLASTLLVFYDIILTSRSEIELIWRTPRTKITVLHLIIRYYSQLFLILTTYASVNTNLSTNVCRIYVQLQLWAATLFVPLVDVLLALRIYALYNQALTARIILLMLWAGETTCIIVFVRLVWMDNLAIIPNPFLGITPGCSIAPNIHNLNINLPFIGGAISISFQRPSPLLMTKLKLRH
ncbi:hypothetical protein M422DRAFT_23667 [Sphaerobolus stellatus SS14]|nr:hypothetical protein M422DRAFT_23667 [Sphaerobolus stellatus SS14]